MKNVERAGVALGAFASVLLTPTLAFAEGTESGGADILIPKMAEFVPALLIFLIIWFLLAKFVWPKVCLLYTSQLSPDSHYGERTVYAKYGINYFFDLVYNRYFEKFGNR